MLKHWENCWGSLGNVTKLDLKVTERNIVAQWGGCQVCDNTEKKKTVLVLSKLGFHNMEVILRVLIKIKSDIFCTK